MNSIQAVNRRTRVRRYGIQLKIWTLFGTDPELADVTDEDVIAVCLDIAARIADRREYNRLKARAKALGEDA